MSEGNRFMFWKSPCGTAPVLGPHGVMIMYGVMCYVGYSWASFSGVYLSSVLNGLYKGEDDIFTKHGCIEMTLGWFCEHFC